MPFILAAAVLGVTRTIIDFKKFCEIFDGLLSCNGRVIVLAIKPLLANMAMGGLLLLPMGACFIRRCGTVFDRSPQKIYSFRLALLCSCR